MSVSYSDDIVCFDYGKGDRVTDRAMVGNYLAYCRLTSAQSAQLKRFFYAVLCHGWVDNIAGEEGDWTPKKLAEQLMPYYLKSGKNRAILLMSCLTGHGFAKQLALHIHLPVVAPKGLAYISPYGELMAVGDMKIKEDGKIQDIKINPEGQVYKIPDIQRWMFFTPSGGCEEVSPHPVLQIPRACELARRYMFMLGNNMSAVVRR